MKKALFGILAALLSCTTMFAQENKLEKRTLLENKIEILVPKDFREMSQEHINLKYPTQNRPKYILTNEATTTNLAFNIMENRADSSMIDLYRGVFKAAFLKKFPDAKQVSDGAQQINGKKVGFLQLITTGKDQPIYNYIFFTDMEGKLLLGTFNCVEKDMPQWLPVSEEIVRSLKIL